uniref:Hydantoinase B/oxoprolinase n=1 Tax=Candidatus Kentrum sp. SD TaxID=2126332 RepID=A0A451BJJ9_9GAMM|nr:MAG: Hydantoinase B/oxoprolinase [Candidatus Kentron sp. SD]
MLSINYSYFAFDGTIHAIFPQFIGHAQLTFGNLRHQYFDPIRGGAGGKGMVRRIRFLKPLSAGILSNHRKIPPFGMAGGEPGQVGRNWVERVDGRCEELASTEEVAEDA